VNDGGSPEGGAGAGRPDSARRFRGLYAGVIAALAAEIALLAWLSGYFR
jgi:hypothetical protein